LRVLDVGCGQGRDAVFIARKGHRVVGVDISANGIRDLNDVAKAEGLPIEGIVADLVDFWPQGSFDVILIDRTLHMLDTPSRAAVLGRLLDHVDESGWLLIADEEKNIPDFDAAFAAHKAAWTVVLRQRGYVFMRRS